METQKMKKRYIFFCLFHIIWLCGCAEIPLTHYYTFRPDFERKAEMTSPKYPYIIAVDSFETDVPYNQEKIVFRSSPYEVNFYNYRQWLRPLDEQVTERILNVFASAGMFQHVQFYAAELPSEYLLRGRIKMFDHWSIENQSTVQIVILYQFSTSEGEHVIWKDMVETTAKIARANTADLKVIEIVKGFEIALQENILQALAAIDGVLSQQK
jgi:ABC-type uncharacterized transport system auxiliary subunit